MIKRRRWPVPGDTAVDRARRIAREYRDALHAHDPAAAATLDSAATELGEGWVCAVAQHDDTDLLTLADLAARLGEKYNTVWKWWHRGRIPREPNGLFYLPAVLDALATWRVAREKNDTARRGEVASRPDGDDHSRVDRKHAT